MRRGTFFKKFPFALPLKKLSKHGKLKFKVFTLDVDLCKALLYERTAPKEKLFISYRNNVNIYVSLKKC